jgi:Cof subfamily protein (haloacid dehalogenase superfamily)
VRDLPVGAAPGDRLSVPPRIRLVATDLDGTLLHPDGTVTERTRAALSAVEARGVAVVFVTGRPIRWMDELWQHVGDHGLAVCSNGGIVYDVGRHAVRRARPIPVDTGRSVARLLREGIPGTTVAVERTTGFAKEPAFMERYALPDDLVVAPAEELFDEHTVKLLARHEEKEPQEFWAEVERLVGDLVTTTWSSVGALVEISAAGVTKASTLAQLCDELDIPASEVVAFGDMPNDLAMLEWAGTSYAMANAHHSVLELAGRTAPSNQDDGVAAVLEDLFGLPPTGASPSETGDSAQDSAS